MSRAYTVIVHEIARDDLPTSSRCADGDDLAGRTAFLFNGHLYSGWPTDYGCWRRDDGEDDVPKAGVTHWIEFPVPFDELVDGATACATA